MNDRIRQRQESVSNNIERLDTSPRKAEAAAGERSVAYRPDERAGYKKMQEQRADGEASYAVPMGLKNLKSKGVEHTALTQSGTKAVGYSNYNAGDRIGRFTYVENKRKGVEPGFVGTKAWLADDTAKTISNRDHKFFKKAEDFIATVLIGVPDDEKAIKIFANIRKVKGIKESHDQRIAGAKNDLEEACASFLGAASKASKAAASSIREDMSVEDQIKIMYLENKDAMTAIKEDSKAFSFIQDHIMATEPKFSKKHYVKLDYKEEDKTGGIVTIPKEKAKGKMHRLGRSQKIADANFGAVREVLANDLMRAMGIYSQKLKLVKAQYEDGNPKLLLDGTHMSGPNGENFSDFGDNIKDGYLVTNEGRSDQSIENLGMYKIFFLLMGDRDAIGSRGDNKGRVGNTFAAIDPGHSLEVGGSVGTTDLMSYKNINSDGTHIEPSGFLDKKLNLGYKNFSMFEDRPQFLKEIMQGVMTLHELRENGKDLEVFDQYADYFSKGSLDFKKQIEEMKNAYVKRRDYILDEVFKDRIAVADKPDVFNVLEGFERVTSEVSDKSPKGEVSLRSLRVLNRAEWNVQKEGNDYVFTFQEPKGNKNKNFKPHIIQAKMQNFIDLHKIPGVVESKGGKIVVRMAQRDVLGSKVQNAFGIDNVKKSHGFSTDQQANPSEEERKADEMDISKDSFASWSSSTSSGISWGSNMSIDEGSSKEEEQ